MFIHAMENETITGTYNAVAPNPVTNKRLAEAIGEGMGKSVVLMPAPAFAMKLAMGEMSSIVLDGVRLCSNKIENTGFNFMYDNVAYALRDVIERKI